ncbi:Sigma-54 dependent transcriptional regulator [Nitrospira sp. KM1]|uniref:sigma-54-dependent transcriptional regulator n=1 Tax=Nitrospira sp. KM1 TaxID=1936990 RepID=UPI0013A715AE|nr:sigma-54 dependent transcriptional regulator [Nitrospira sp. KM1]BCA53107.1 Sigma-54 dependent transcriptional regulator [Nitrospira sp. KM1]
MRARILIIDDDPDIVLALENRVTWMGHEPLVAGNGKDGVRMIEQEHPDLVLLDIELPHMSGLDILKQVKTLSDAGRSNETDTEGGSSYTSPMVIMLTAFGTIERAVQAMHLGAFDFIPKPFTADHLTVVINKALAAISLRRRICVLQHEVDDQYGSIIGDNAKLTTQLKIARQAAAMDVIVLVLGETGTGKEVVARAVHGWSPRKDKPFVPVNCAAIPKDLLENELFGHERGAFTGAVKREAGKIEVAEGGTLFLDEIGDMSLSMQSHLLRVLQDKEFYRVGGTQAVRTDVRYVAATNKDLKQAIKLGTFREDLYYRLDVISVTLPPLRDRMGDVPALAKYFLRRAASRFGTQKQASLSDAALRMLSGYSWPGNIRELENILMRAYILSPGGLIEPEHLNLSNTASAQPSGDSVPAPSPYYHDMMEAYSRRVIEEALKRNEWNQTKASEELGLQRTYFTKLIRQKNIAGRPPKQLPDTN